MWITSLTLHQRSQSNSSRIKGQNLLTFPRKKTIFRWWPRPYTPRKCMNVDPKKGPFQSSNHYFSRDMSIFGDRTLPLFFSNFRMGCLPRRGFLPLKFHGIGISVKKHWNFHSLITLPWRFLIGVFAPPFQSWVPSGAVEGFFFHPNYKRWRTWEAGFLALMVLSLSPPPQKKRRPPRVCRSILHTVDSWKESKELPIFFCIKPAA